MYRRLIAPLAAVSISLAACSDDSDSPAADTAAPTSSPAAASATTVPGSTVPASTAPVTSAPAPDGPAGLGSGDSWSVLGALAEIPDNADETFEISAGDVAQAAELFGIERPESIDDIDAALDEWVLPLTFPGAPEYRTLPVWVPLDEPLLPRNISLLGDFEATLGWSVVDIDAYVTYRPPAPGYLAVATGAFADDALTGLAEVAPGVVTTREGDDFEQNITEISGVDQLGRPVRAARDGDHMVLSLSTERAEQWLAGGSATLADDPQLAAMAEMLDAHGVLTAQIFRNDFSAGMAASLTPEQAAQLSEVVGAVPEFDTVGIGWAIGDDGEPYTVVVYDAASDTTDELAEQLRTVFAEGVSIVTRAPLTDTLGAVDPEIVADGTTVTVTYQPQDRFWWSAVTAVFSRDLPFVHG